MELPASCLAMSGFVGLTKMKANMLPRKTNGVPIQSVVSDISNAILEYAVCRYAYTNANDGQHQVSCSPHRLSSKRKQAVDDTQWKP